MVNLEKIEFFSDLDPEDLDRLQDIVREIQIPAGKTILKEGDASDAFYIVKSGSVSILKNNPFEFAPKVLSHLQAGDFFGEMGVIMDSSRSATAVAVENVSLYQIMKSDLLTLLESNPIMADRIRKTMMRRYNDNVSWLSKDQDS